MRSGYAKSRGKKRSNGGVSAIERRNALTFSLLDNFPDNLSTGGEVGIKIPYSQGTCENQLDFGQFSPLPPEKQLLFAWQHPSCTQTRKNDPFKGRLATLVIFSFVSRRSRSKLHGNTLVLLRGTAGTVSSFRENLLRFLAARCIRNQQPLVCAIHAPRKKGLSQRGAIFQLA